MAIELLPYEEALVPAVKEFNTRMLAAGGVGREFLLQETVPKPVDSPIFYEWTLAVENGAIRGGYTIQWRHYKVGDQSRLIGDYYGPISEGIIDKKYAVVGALMLKNALRTNPWLYAVGMGGLDQPLAKMMKAMGWGLTTVPFRFYVARPYRFLRELQHLRRSGFRRSVLDLLSMSGLGWLGVRGFEQWSAQGSRGAIPQNSEACEAFGSWADDLWERHANDYVFAGVRNSAALNVLYSDGRFQCWKLLRKGEAAGWVVVLLKQMQQNKYFGDMRVGVIVDAWCALSDTRWAIATAKTVLRNAGADMVFANTPHPAWLEALRCERFLAGPSNFGFAVSPQIAKIMEPFEQKSGTSAYLMRGDGDGLSNFL